MAIPLSLLRPQLSALLVHQGNSSCSSIFAPSTPNSTFSFIGRLDYHRSSSSTIISTRTSGTSMLSTIGCVVNTTKSQLEPTQVIEYLGFQLDTTTMTAKLPGKKLRDLRKSIQQILKNPTQPPRTIQSIIMRVQAATFAILPARHLLYLKNQLVKGDPRWDHPHPLNQQAIEGLKWLYSNLEHWNGRSMIPSTPTATIFVDAGDTGWGCMHHHKTANGLWAQKEAKQHINWKELKSAFLALHCFPQLTNTTIMIRTDNTTSLAYISKQGGARSVTFMGLATKLWKWCLQRNIMLMSNNVAESLNTVADRESRKTFSKNQWMINPTVFQSMQQDLGFLLCMAAFLRPSDVNSIDSQSCQVDLLSGQLLFQVVDPKEKKTQVYHQELQYTPNVQFPDLCPVVTFIAYRDHSSLNDHATRSFLLVNVKQIRQQVTYSTVSSWLRPLIRLFTSEPRVSIRSIASILALACGPPLDDIITRGNWASSTTFENHYRRYQALKTDFTSALLVPSSVPADIAMLDDGGDLFEDALSDFLNSFCGEAPYILISISIGLIQFLREFIRP